MLASIPVWTHRPLSACAKPSPCTWRSPSYFYEATAYEQCLSDGGAAKASYFDRAAVPDLVRVGQDKIAAIKAVRELMCLGLKEAKDLVDGVLGWDGLMQRSEIAKPAKLFEGSAERVELGANMLRGVGCVVEIAS